MPAASHHVEFETDGVHTEGVESDDAAAASRAPIIFVHGGNHGSWCWHRMLPALADAGWHAYALNWYGHYKSRPLPVAEFVRRGIADVTDEIARVAGRVGTRPILIGHSMGGLAAQKYAESHPVAALVLMTPVSPAGAGVTPVEIPIPVPDDRPFPPPPFEMARGMFFHGVPEAEARAYHDLLCPESPRAVREATQFTVPVDRTRIACPILVIAGAADVLTPPEALRRLADHYGAEFALLPGKGHSLPYEPGWRDTVDLIVDWSRRVLP